MMPILDLLIIIGLIVFYFVEKWSVTNIESRRKGINVKNIKMIYLVSMIGFLITQPLSIGNSKVVLQYYEDPSLNSVSKLLMSLLDYSTLFLILLISICVLYYYSHFNTHKRLLTKLTKFQGKKELLIEDDSEIESSYRTRNPLWKAKRGFYDKLTRIDSTPNTLL